MKGKILAVIIFTFSSIAGLQAQTYLAYNTPESNKKEINIEKETSKSIAPEKAYKWEFLSSVPESFDAQLEKNVSAHDFGKRVACLKKLVEKHYITKEDVIPGDPMMRTIVLKPTIYYSTRKLEKHLKQKVKDRSMRLSDATKEMEHILEVALSLIDMDEENSFEALVKKNKNSAEKQIEIFSQVKLYNIYEAN